MAPHADTDQINTPEAGKAWWRTQWMEAIWQAADLTPGEKLVALAYADHARDGRTAWVTLDRLMERTALSRRGAQKILDRLEGTGWLVVVETARQHRTTEYELVIPTAHAPAQGRTECTPEAPEVHSVPPGVHSVPPRGALSAPNQRSYLSTYLSLSREEALVARLLSLDHGDERLKKIQQLLDKHKPKSPCAWLRTVAKNGDLLGLLEQAGQAAPVASKIDRKAQLDARLAAIEAQIDSEMREKWAASETAVSADAAPDVTEALADLTAWSDAHNQPLDADEGRVVIPA